MWFAYPELSGVQAKMSKGGLAFLNKKSWHTGKIQNHELVCNLPLSTLAALLTFNLRCAAYGALVVWWCGMVVGVDCGAEGEGREGQTSSASKGN